MADKDDKAAEADKDDKAAEAKTVSKKVLTDAERVQQDHDIDAKKGDN